MSDLLPCPFCGGKAQLHPPTYSDENPSEIIGPACVNCQNCCAAVIDTWEDDALAAWNRRAARSAPEAGKAVVKPLEWESERTLHIADWLAGTYIISTRIDGSAILKKSIYGKDPERTECASFQAAKAAAQADFEQRILSALASVAPSGAEPVAWQWRALEDSHPRTAWKDPELGDRPGWEALAKKHPERFTVERRALYSVPPSAAASEAEAASLRRKLEEHRKALAEVRERINRYADTAAEHDLVARIDALTEASE